MRRKKTRKTRRIDTTTDRADADSPRPDLARAFAAALLLAAAILLAPTAAAPTDGVARNPDVDEASAILARVEERYESARPYRIAFEQELYWALADSTQIARGALVADRPSRLSIRYEDGGRIIVSGDSLWVYVPQTNQFFSAKTDSADVAMDPALMLRQYRPDVSDPFLEAESSPGKRIIVLKPRNRYSDPVRLVVEVDVHQYLITRIVAYSSVGDRTTYRITETRFGVLVPADEFLPYRPPGAELIRGSPAPSG